MTACNTVTSVGGAATATVSALGTSKLTATGPVEMSMVTAGLTAITAGDVSPHNRVIIRMLLAMSPLHVPQGGYPVR